MSVHALAGAVLVAVPSPSPSPAGELDPYDVSPGLLGFLVIFAVVLACIPLFRSMTGKVRRLEHRARAEADAEQGRAGADAAEGDAAQGDVARRDAAQRDAGEVDGPGAKAQG